MLCAAFFGSSGFKPGMSGLDLYSTINAGAPGRYGASDANNGGAPGSVRDKWERQMGGHRQKAQALLGDLYVAGPGAAPAPALGPGRNVADRPVAAPTQQASVGQTFGDLLAPRAPASFASTIDNYSRQREEAEAEHQARQARLAELFSMLPA